MDYDPNCHKIEVTAVIYPILSHLLYSMSFNSSCTDPSIRHCLYPAS